MAPRQKILKLFACCLIGLLVVSDASIVPTQTSYASPRETTVLANDYVHATANIQGSLLGKMLQIRFVSITDPGHKKVTTQPWIIPVQVCTDGDACTEVLCGSPSDWVHETLCTVGPLEQDYSTLVVIGKNGNGGAIQITVSIDVTDPTPEQLAIAIPPTHTRGTPLAIQAVVPITMFPVWKPQTGGKLINVINDGIDQIILPFTLPYPAKLAGQCFTQDRGQALQVFVCAASVESCGPRSTTVAYDTETTGSNSWATSSAVKPDSYVVAITGYGITQNPNGPLTPNNYFTCTISAIPVPEPPTTQHLRTSIA